MDINEMSRRANYATMQTIARLGCDLSDQDIEDVQQEALTAFWIGWQRESNPAYAYTCAKNAVIKCIDRQLFAKNPMSTSDIDNELLEPHFKQTTPRSPLPDETFVEIASFLYKLRNKHGDRGLVAAKRDAMIIDMVLQERSGDAISMELGINRKTVNTYRFRLREALREYLEQN